MIKAFSKFKHTHRCYLPWYQEFILNFLQIDSCFLVQSQWVTTLVWTYFLVAKWMSPSPLPPHPKPVTCCSYLLLINPRWVLMTIIFNTLLLWGRGESWRLWHHQRGSQREEEDFTWGIFFPGPCLHRFPNGRWSELHQLLLTAGQLHASVDSSLSSLLTHCMQVSKVYLDQLAWGPRSTPVASLRTS